MRARIKWRGARATAIALCAAGAAVMALLAPSISDAPAYANPSAGFDAGNIIDDALFYDGTAWNAAQIQSFLNQRVPRCTIGDPGRGAYTPWGSTMISGACLGGSFWTTAARPANAYCSAMAGAVNESAASYIARVGAACGISPKVLLVMLEKEQSLVTDTWPTVRQYDFAMGYDCPDSGPNNSPNCNNGAGGFPAQMYRGAWQLKVYKAFPNSYNYRPFQNNRIQWHPNAGCGTSDVWIANWATAALYIYTPYRPNQAALNAGWGTGDSCSSYGNRNFYNFYTSWFGSAQGVQVSEYFTAFHTSNGGLSGLYGRPLQVAQPVGIGVVQEFSGGTLYWNPYTGVGGVNGAIRDYYRVVGGPFGVLGYPIGRENAVSGGASQRFERGYVYWSSPYGSQPVGGAILPLYTSEGGPAGYLGFPTGGERPVTGGVKQEFERGTAYWSNRTGASVINGAIRGLYLSEGGPDGYLGLPVGAEVRANGVSRQEFERGTAYWSNGTGASVINGAIRGLYLSEGGPDGYLGLPVGAEVRANG
ncbi:LGFP repeat-containing protein, partial [Leucobacter sp. MMO-66]|uniref:LGFP repeat-containing protein n=4 Tax=Leucobacter TaxID=55968 RepID=UPI003FA5D73D